MGSEQLALLERCMIEQTVVEGGKRRLRGKEDGFKGSGMLQSPYDPEYHYLQDIPTFART